MSWFLFLDECNHNHRTVPNQMGRGRRSAHFHRFRSKRSLTQPDAHGKFWRLTFFESLDGPRALGFRCQFGRGLFCLSDGKGETE